MNAEQIAKLKYAVSRVNQFYDPSQASSEDLTTIMNELPELLALAERTTSPVSQMTDEQKAEIVWNAEDAADAWADGREQESTSVEVRARVFDAILAAVAPHAQAPAHETIVQQGDELMCTACGTTALAQPVDLSKLNRYSPSFIGELPTDHTHPFVLFNDVEQLLAAAPAAPTEAEK